MFMEEEFICAVGSVLTFLIWIFKVKMFLMGNISYHFDYFFFSLEEEKYFSLFLKCDLLDDFFFLNKSMTFLLHMFYFKQWEWKLSEDKFY